MELNLDNIIGYSTALSIETHQSEELLIMLPPIKLLLSKILRVTRQPLLAIVRQKLRKLND